MISTASPIPVTSEHTSSRTAPSVVRRVTAIPDPTTTASVGRRSEPAARRRHAARRECHIRLGAGVAELSGLPVRFDAGSPERPDARLELVH